MKISYAISVCNELVEIQRLLPFLLDNKRDEDEIIILYDGVNGTNEVETYLQMEHMQHRPHFSWFRYEFDGHFANMKNELTKRCSGDYIFQIDADEIPNESLIENLPQILEINDVDVVLVPRVNTVDGLTNKHIQKWGWRLNENGWVNWPDMQWRIYKNSEDIKWMNKVHEVLHGYKTLSNLPLQEEFALYHPKNIERQEKQNKYYNTL